MNENGGYLMVHFIGDTGDGEQIHFALSKDGLHYQDLNNGKPVLRSDVGECGARDPFIIRSYDGSRFYIIATDLRIASQKGWTEAVTHGSQSVLIWESEDLVHFEGPRLVRVGIPEAGCVWAPEAIYDEKRQAYLMYFASMVKREKDQEPKQRIYAAWTKDFRSFEPTFLYIERENHVIDTTIVKQDSVYYRFSKDETTKNIHCDYSDDLLGEFKIKSCPELEAIPGVEGPAAVYLLEQKAWCLMIDRFATHSGYLPLLSDDLSKGKFRVLAEDQFDLGHLTKRHGSLLAVTEEEYQRLVKNYGKN
ncbi:MAG: 1,4-beta-xylanase [Lachnospiraceae bacterium]|nr:1,4-beta-xylanase [Lachnospiraceae bacterium]